MVDGAKVVTTDIDCTNGVIHVIDSVILPAEKKVVKASTPEASAAAKAAYEANKSKRDAKKAPKVGPAGVPTFNKKRQNGQFDKAKRRGGA